MRDRRHTWLTAALACAGAAVCVGAVGGGRSAGAEHLYASRHAVAPPAGHTGGFSEPTCVVCHEGAPLNAPGGAVDVQGLADSYAPGGEHVLTVVLRSEEMGAAGFQLSARHPDGSRAGTLRALDARTAVTEGPGGVPYAHHTSEGSRVSSPDLASWTLSWTAPPSGEVRIHVAANSGNGDDSPLSDLVYAAARTVLPR